MPHPAAPPTTPTIGVLDIGGTHVTGATVDPVTGTVFAEQRFALDPHADAASIMDACAQAGRHLAPEPRRPWGIAIPGPFDYAAGIGRFTGVEKFDALDGYDVGSALAERWQCPREAIHFVNDATAYGLGEWAYGAARGIDRVVSVTLGTGVGSVFLAGGRPVDSGEQVPPSGHAHHLEVAGRPLEDFVSRRALRGGYQRRGGDPAFDVLEIAQRVATGEPAAREAWDEAFQTLGAALGPYLVRFEAQLLVLGGSIAGSFPLVLPPLRQGLASAGIPDLAVVAATHLHQAPLLGAAHWAAIDAQHPTRPDAGAAG